MAEFNLGSFLANPSYNSLTSCRKDGLAQIADHFSLTHSKQILRRDLRALVLGKLVEQELIMLRAQAEPPELDKGTLGGEGSHEQEEAPPDRERDAVDGQPRTPLTLPKYDPLWSVSTESMHEARLKVCLTRLRIEADEKALNREAQLRLEMKRLEIEAETAMRLHELELASQREMLGRGTAGTASSTSLPSPTFDISKHVALVPLFRETEVDSYFSAFEHIASALQWPSEVWPLLLQCKIHGKAQDAVAVLLVEESLNYEHVKTAILRTYELVPEAYRQKFRIHKKASSQSYVEFAREKGTLFDKWCSLSKVTDYKSLREILLVEEFKRCLPKRIVVYLNEQKVSSLSCAAVLADEYVLTHKTAFGSQSGNVSAERRKVLPPVQPSKSSNSQREDRGCFYCHKPGHVIGNCLTLNHKEQTA